MAHDIADLAGRLAGRAKDICERLLPGGKIIGHEYCIGDVHGSPGQSLKINLRTGKWKDFSASDKGGDLIELWRQCTGLSLPAVLKEVREYLGIETPAYENTRKPKTYRKPEVPKARRAVRGTEVEQYLRGERAIPTDIIERFNIGQADAMEGISSKTNKPYSMPGPWILFPYRRKTAEGKIETFNMKWLHIERDEAGKKRTRQEKDAEPGLFGWHLVPDDLRWVIITEGEIDAMTWTALGYTALSVPMGAGGGDKAAWIEHDFDRLAQFETIYLNYDADVDRGVVMEVAKRLGRHRCMILTLPHKDINECVSKHGMTVTEIQPYIERAEACHPATLKNARDFTKQVIDHFYPTDQEAAGIAIPFGPDGAFAFRPGELTLFTGLNGSGKSIAVSQLALIVADRGKRVCTASMEMRPKDTLERKHRQITQAVRPSVHQIEMVQEWLGERLWIYNVLGSTTVDELMDAMLYARRRFGCWLFIIDSLMRCGLSVDDYEGQDKFVKRLCAFVEAEECHVVLIAHSKKKDDEAKPVGKMDIKGSGGITDNAFNVFSLWRNKPKEVKYDKVASDPAMDGLRRAEKLAALQNEPDAILICDKQRLGTGWEGRIRLWFTPGTVSYRGSRDGVPPKLLSTKPGTREQEEWEML